MIHKSGEPKEQLTRVVGSGVEGHVRSLIRCKGPPYERPRYQRSWKYFGNFLVENWALELALDLYLDVRWMRRTRNNQGQLRQLHI